MSEKLTHAEILKKAARFSPTGFRRRREGMAIPKWFDFRERANKVLADPSWSLLSKEEECK